MQPGHCGPFTHARDLSGGAELPEEVKSLASIDRVLEALGIVWSPIDRTPKVKPREAVVTAPQPARSASHPIDAFSLSYLLDRIRGLEDRIDKLCGWKAARDDDADDQGRESEGRELLEAAGNVVCLPGVTLADILHGADDSDGSGPSAA